MSLERVLCSFRRLQEKGDITAWVRVDPQPGSFVELPEDLSPPLRQALSERGIRRLYSHQAEAYALARQGRHWVVVTPTASGKSLCYNLPILNDLAADPDLRALYLFPTKALAQDQMAELRRLVQAAGLPLGVHTYDGDTPADRRPRIREEGRLILTNPDMLHTALLPHHPRWVQFFQNLRYVVVDELHAYRGIFGSHVANVFRRLKRIARFYDSRIQFLCASATIANPEELAANLIEEPVPAVERNGAPRSSKDLIFYNPPLLHPELGLRRSAFSTARRFAERLMREEVQTLVFASSRVNVEVLLKRLRKMLPGPPGGPEKVRGYRGGYLPRTRREIERQLRNREILGVVSTNALELGIDIGSLEACVLAGYPGTIAGAWQQIGRAGRRTGHSVAVLVARNLPLDQFIVKHPEYFLGRSPEHGLIHPDNLQILVSHLKCAAFELPLQQGERFGKENLEEILEFLAEQGILYRSGKRWNWTAEAYPADAVSLRNISEENFVVFDAGEGNQAVAEVDFESAPELIHRDAVYLCEGRQYQVERLDYPGRKAYAREVQVDYYTEAVTESGLRVLRSEGRKEDHACTVEHGEVHLVKKVPGFKKIRFQTGENLGYGKVDLPVHELHTAACWFTLSEGFIGRLTFDASRLLLGLAGIAYAYHSVATLLVMGDPRDLGYSVGDRSARWFARTGQDGLIFFSAGLRAEVAPPGTAESLEGMLPGAAEPGLFDRFEPSVFLYDNYPGGVGYSERVFESHREALERALWLIRACNCSYGCPSCVGPVTEVGRETKAVALAVLEQMVGASALARH